MHITVEDQNNGHRITVCYNRELSEIRIIKLCCAAHAYKIEQIVKSLGAPVVSVVVPANVVSMMEKLGYKATGNVHMSKELT